MSKRFPGRIRPGLIEAGSSRSRPSRLTPRFRGGSAPASLKPLEVEDPGGRGVGVFPGRIRPGLIEAISPIRRARRRQAVSGADPPRPH